MVKSERQKLELGFDNSWIIEISTQKYSPVKILIQVTIETGSLEVEEGYSLIKKNVCEGGEQEVFSKKL